MDDFLNTFDGMLGQHPDWLAAKRALDYVFGTQRPNLRHYPPTLVQTRRFIETLQRAMEHEMKADQAKLAKRKEALRLILEENPGFPRTRIFRWINHAKFSFQLALRVREPSLIDQDNMNFCCGAAVVTDFAKREPDAFVKYAISLLTIGTGTLRHMPIDITEMPDAVWSESAVTGKIVEADLVTLGGLNHSMGRGSRRGANPELIKGMLFSAGMRDIDCDGSNRAHLTIDVEKIRRAVAAGKVVMLSVDGDAARHMVLEKEAIMPGGVNARYSGARRTGAGKDGLPTPMPNYRRDANNSERHMIVVTRFAVTATDVDIKFYSWGQSAHVKIPTDKFAQSFIGYIIATP